MVVATQFGQQIIANGLEIVFIAPLLDKAVQLRIVISCFGITTGFDQIIAAVDLPFYATAVVSLFVLFIIAGSFGLLTLHLTDLCAVKQYQGAEGLDFFVDGLRLGLIHGK